ncbi:NCS1 family nucleobase:cation symporter-1 [Gluconobacter frateurii]|uniref:APC transporter NCS1 n=1 Tax=Gluconobacter frateurii NRIC 0228 TaxID=1307946 RepID=A0ABQ0QAN3_9PROT|nr:NCS1 family nucleobase:cation symporter-1 [Gluconobacter frateurii]GBR11130.1 APC transporter NCS1 [Gluconobacter frateurii NRIC 0228]GLP89004.1 nitrate reductase [Gluconobacter frateurii]
MTQLPDVNPSGRLTNADLAPVRDRHWAWKDYLFLWMSDVHSVAGYMTVGTFFAMGLPVRSVLFGLLVAIVAVQVLCNLIAVPSLRSGAPFPVIIRSVFGVYGAIIPALVRGIIAIGWYGIQTWLASNAVVLFLLRVMPSLTAYSDVHQHGFLGLSMMGWGAFLLVWSLQLAVFWRGMESIRHFIDWAGPAIYIMMVLLDGILLWKTRGQISFSVLPRSDLTLSQHLTGLLNVISLTIAFFSPIILNFGDFSRYGVSIEAVRRGNFWGLPINFMAFSALALTTVTLTQPVFGKILIDPVETVTRLDNQAIMLVGILTFVVATIGINISANFVSAAFDFSNIAPASISWKGGGIIASIGAILLTPWNLYARPDLIHLTLDVLGLFIAPVTGILLADYYLVQRQRLDVGALYSTDPAARYWYRGGVNPVAVYALVLAVLVGLANVFMPQLAAFQNFAWFTGFFSGLAFHLLLTRLAPVDGKAGQQAS